MELVFICPNCQVVYDEPIPDVCEYCKGKLKPDEDDYIDVRSKELEEE